MSEFKFQIISKELPGIDSYANEDNVLGTSVCNECKHCLVFENERHYCTSGTVHRIQKHPITGLEGRIFIPNEEDSESFTFDIDELPFPSCYHFNEQGNCKEYEFGTPNKLELNEEPDVDKSIELDAYMRSLK